MHPHVPCVLMGVLEVVEVVEVMVHVCELVVGIIRLGSQLESVPLAMVNFHPCVGVLLAQAKCFQIQSEPHELLGGLH
jgi:hypothetical protein